MSTMLFRFFLLACLLSACNPPSPIPVAPADSGIDVFLERLHDHYPLEKDTPGDGGRINAYVSDSNRNIQGLALCFPMNAPDLAAMMEKHDTPALQHRADSIIRDFKSRLLTRREYCHKLSIYQESKLGCYRSTYYFLPEKDSATHGECERTDLPKNTH